MTQTGRPDHTERSTLAACVAHIAGASARDVPLDREEQRAWLGERGLGLVPVNDAASFSWAGPWIALRPAHDGGGARDVVMFGVPSGPIWDPGETDDQVLDGFVLAPLDFSAWPPHRPTDVSVGIVEALVLAPAAEAPVRLADKAPPWRDTACKATATPTESERSAPADWAAHSPSSTPPFSTASTARSTTAATSSCEEQTSTHSSAGSLRSVACASAAAGCANHAPTSTVSTIAACSSPSCTAEASAQTSSTAAL